MRHFIETNEAGDCEARHELGNFVAISTIPLEPTNVMHEIDPPVWGAGWPAVGSEYLPTATSVLTYIDGVFGSRETGDLTLLISTAVAQTYLDVDGVYDLAVGKRSTVYAIAEVDARAYKAGGYVGEAAISVASYAEFNPTLTLQTHQWAADKIIQKADTFKYAELLMRTTMFKSQTAMRAATTHSELQTAITTWKGFISGIKSQISA
jgi:hypothetical protein